MQEYFAEQVQTEPQFFLEKLKTPGTYPAPEGGFPELEGYNVVSVRLREATITATNDPVVVSQTPVIAASQPVAAGYAPQGSAYAPPPPPPNYAGHGYGAPYVQQPTAAPAQIAAKPRKRLLGRDLAIWICVAQLGVIIWWLFGPATEREQTGAKTASATAPLLAPPVAWPMNMFSGFAPEKLKAQITAAKNHVQKKTKSAKKHSGRSGGKMMIPPPPPEMANSKLMVPPPPVAYSLPGPGAVAASTLPPAAKHEAAAVEAPPVVLKKEDVVADAEPAPHVVPAEHAPTASIVPAEEPTTAAAPAPMPEWLQRVPSYNWQDATNIAQPPVRRVMHNNRQRTITDR